MKWLQRIKAWWHGRFRVEVTLEFERRYHSVMFIFNTIKNRYPHIRNRTAMKIAKRLYRTPFIWFQAEDGVLQIEANPHYGGRNLLAVGFTLAKLNLAEL